MIEQKTAVVIGAGIAGLSTAAFLAKSGWSVTVIEKNEAAGGRARKFSAEGFTFDMGPSWYWMPEVFENFFSTFGKSVADFYSLIRLDPSYRVYWDHSHSDFPSDYDGLRTVFEHIEPGSGAKLDKYLAEAETKYDIGMRRLVYTPALSVTEFLNWPLLRNIFKLDVFSSIKKHIAKSFSSPRIRQVLEFPVLFLGALPKNTPALYSLMNYADIKGGTWYPSGGMYRIVEAMQQLCEELGVKFIFDTPVQKILVKGDTATAVVADDKILTADVVISAADYHFTEMNLLESKFRTYSESYWNKRILAPSCLVYYIGLNRKLPGLLHHSLFFDVPFEKHADEIYSDPKWPSEPLFYMCVPSTTDASVAPEGCENLFLLIPVASGLKGDDQALREFYLDKILDRIQERTAQDIRPNIIFKRSYATSNFVSDYNSYKGNAYGLANTLMQTAILKPSCRSRKVKNLFYAGQFTVPGPGVPPAIISGEVVAKLVNKIFISKV
ncbi:MAG TPA: phytoene desaturase family protein [Flavobacterium sp.]